MKEYCGRFPINKGLTKELGYEDFVIFRDPEYGLYAYSPSRRLEVNLTEWNCTLQRVKDNPLILECWANDITKAIIEF